LGEACWYEAGQEIFHQGNEPLSLYYVVDGTVEVVRSFAGGQHMIVAVRRQGDVIGLPAMVKRTSYFADAIACGPCVIRSLPVDRFRILIRESPQIIAAVMDALAEELLHQIRLAGDAALPPATRMRKRLHELALHGRNVQGGWWLLEACWTQTHLGKFVGIRREPTNRMLARLERQGWVRRTRQGILVKWDAGSSRRPASSNRVTRVTDLM
jgi:CRP-like cAMP-binding protein